MFTHAPEHDRVLQTYSDANQLKDRMTMRAFNTHMQFSSIAAADQPDYDVIDESV